MYIIRIIEIIQIIQIIPYNLNISAWKRDSPQDDFTAKLEENLKPTVPFPDRQTGDNRQAVKHFRFFSLYVSNPYQIYHACHACHTSFTVLLLVKLCAYGARCDYVCCCLFHTWCCLPVYRFRSPGCDGLISPL